MRLFLIESHRYYFIVEHSSSVQAYLRASNIFLILEYVRANLDDSVCPLQRTGNIGKTMAREKSSLRRIPVQNCPGAFLLDDRNTRNYDIFRSPRSPRVIMK